MHSRYNKAIEAAIGQVLVVGMVVLGFVQHLPPNVVIGATVGLALLTVFKVYWVSNGGQERVAASPVPETNRRRLVQPDAAADQVVREQVLPEGRSRAESVASESRNAESWREEGPGRHQRPRSSYRTVTQVAPVAPRAVSRIRDDASEI